MDHHIRFHKKYKRLIVAVLSILVILQTVSSLSFRVETMTGIRKELSCSATPHEHTEECYDDEGNVVEIFPVSADSRGL